MSANNLFGFLGFCKQFFPGFFIPAPLQKNNGPSLNRAKFQPGYTGIPANWAEIFSCDHEGDFVLFNRNVEIPENRAAKFIKLAPKLA